MNTPSQVYSLAAKFADQAQAKRVYDELEGVLKTYRFKAHYSRVMVRNEMYVSFLHEGPESSIPAPVLQAVRRVLSKGEQLGPLPPDTIANIQARRAARRAQGIGVYESHEPTVSSYQYPAIRDVETKEILAEYPEYGTLTGERPYSRPAPGSPVYTASLEDLPEEIRDRAIQKQAEIRERQRNEATAKAMIPTPGQARPSPGKAGKPLVERYLTYLRVAKEQAQARLHDKTGITRDQYNFNLLLMTSYHDTYYRMANKAQKYRLAASAQTMIDALRPRPLLLEDVTLEILVAIASHERGLDPDISTPILQLPAAPIWLELEQPTSDGKVAGIFFTCADREVEEMLAQEQRPVMREVLNAAAKRPDQQYTWSVNFIASDGTPETRYSYQEKTRAWLIVPDAKGEELCPTGECREQDHGNNVFDIVPCAFCGTILAYWRSWIVTALLAIAGDFAATEAAEWPRKQEKTTRKVKRPNSAKYDEVPVTHDYYLVSFDASVKRVHLEQKDEEREVTPRGSWVEVARQVDPESVVYVKHDFGQTQRKLDPERNPRWKAKRTVEVRPYSKRVPMKVENLKHKIVRVIASKYEKTGEKEL